jgi:hypothetical protein
MSCGSCSGSRRQCVQHHLSVLGDNREVSARGCVGLSPVLERGNPLFDIPTTGAVAGGVFYFVANSQLRNYGAKGMVDRAKLRPISILRLKL